MAKQGKCNRCKVRFVWNRELLLGLAYCVMCGQRLEGTTRESSLPVRDLGRIQPLGKDPRFFEAKDGSASLWDEQKDRLVVVPWKKILDERG